MTTEADRYARALRAASPVDVVLTAVEITHPDLAQPLRIVNNADDQTIGGATYLASRFDVRWADSVGHRPPRAELVVDNVGRALSDVLEATEGARGATVRFIEALAGAGDATVRHELTLDNAGARTTNERAVFELGFDAGLDGPAVTWRHDYPSASRLL